MISLSQCQCSHWEACSAGAQPPENPCGPCPASIKLAKVHEPAVELGANWALGRLDDCPIGGSGDAD